MVWFSSCKQKTLSWKMELPPALFARYTYGQKKTHSPQNNFLEQEDLLPTREADSEPRSVIQKVK